jgi:hypothetical protein
MNLIRTLAVAAAVASASTAAAAPGRRRSRSSSRRAYTYKCDVHPTTMIGRFTVL